MLIYFTSIILPCILVNITKYFTTNVGKKCGNGKMLVKISGKSTFINRSNVSMHTVSVQSKNGMDEIGQPKNETEMIELVNIHNPKISISDNMDDDNDDDSSIERNQSVRL